MCNCFTRLIKHVKYFFHQFFSPVKSFSLYFSSYGGWGALLKSIYFWASIILAILSCYFNLEASGNGAQKWSWINSAKSIFPSVLGFSLGGYAILISFGDKDFLAVLRMKNEDEKISPYMKINGSFLHFIFLQFLGLFFSSLAEMTHSEYNLVVYFLGSAIFFYAICSIIMTALTILNAASWFDKMARINEDKENSIDKENSKEN